MADTYLPISKPGRPQLGSQAIKAANDLLDLCQRVEGLLGIANEQWDAGNHSTLQAQFGFADQTDAAAYLTLLTQMNEILNLETEVTGVNRRSRIAQYINRLAGQ